MALTKVTSGLISADASSVDLNIDAGTLYIDATNNRVGIGTSSPADTLDIERTTGVVSLGLQSRDSSDTKINFGDNNDGDIGIINYAHSDNSMQFTTNASERMRIDSSGNVGINTTVPAAYLGFDAAAYQNGAENLSSIRWNDVGTADSIVQGYTIGTDGANLWLGANSYVNSGGGVSAFDTAKKSAYVSVSSYIGGLAFGSAASGNPVESMRIDSSGNLLVGGTSVLQSAKVSVHSGSVAVENGGVDGTYQNAFVAVYTTNNNEHNAIKTAVSSAAGNSGFQFMVSDGGGSSGTTESFRINRTSCTVVGSLSKGSGSFKIDHPLESKKDTHHLVHSFVEAPQADNIYRGKIDLVDGSATVNIDTVAGMTEGTFVALNREVQCFTSNESDWDAVKGSVSGNILTIECQNTSSTATVSWLVIGERQDQHMYDTDWTDDNGKVIVEPLKGE